MSQFQGKIVFITGASSGIGAEMARVFAKRGADLVITARRLERLEALAKEIKDLGRKVLPIQCDVTIDEDLKNAVQTTNEQLGPIDVVVANAGFGVAGSFESLCLKDFQSQMDTNVYGLIRTIYATLPDLKKQKGSLALVASVAGYVSMPNSSPYSMSKFAVRALAEAIRAELKHEGVAVTLISPGFVASEIRQVSNDGQYQKDAKDPIPSWLVMPTNKAAKQMVNAIAKRKREIVVTFHGKVIKWLSQHMAWLYHFISAKAAKKAPSNPNK